ncbi:glycosyltransferase family 39 protein [Methanolobus chelungpuianus]|uniref:Uncharacterized protein n=1 Tax=Methanolobus chelungpuianus TaxID=502115 RepID=A0AAE3H7G1_9EURY|nr:glycosyltransferase family 39 protein [Methanolobus chelungpuianus]MCQ6961817.1 hypothetical protein [Methanolobus chelungpuianus]
MITFIQKKRDLLLEITSNLLIVEIILIILHYLTSFVVSIWIDVHLLMVATVACGFAWFFIYIQKDEEHFREITQPHMKGLFLFCLLLVVLSGLSFDLIQQNHFLKSIESSISSVQPYLIVFLIGAGFLMLHFKKESIPAKAGLTEEIMEMPAKGKAKGVGKLIYMLTGRENLWYNAFLLVILTLFFITRLYDTDFINGTDNYNVLGIKNMYENGMSVYRYSPITDFLMLKIVTSFGFDFFTIKIPFILYSFITLIFIYLSSGLINRNLALVSSFLYVISPWAIIHARITRDYSFDLMVGSIALYLCFVIYRKISETESPKKILLYLLFFSFVPLSLVFVYHNIRSQTIVVGIYVLFTALYILNHLLNKIVAGGTFSGMRAMTVLRANIRSVNLVYWVAVYSALLSALFLIEKFPFVFGFKDLDFIYFDFFFNPLTDSPWQWFYGVDIKSLFFYGMFLLGLFSFDSSEVPRKYLLILFSSFVFGLVLYGLKYETHLEYIPVRYLYFLFLPYIIIFANSVLNLIKLFSSRPERTVLIITLVLLINPTALLYSVNPVLAYQNEKISNVQVDNIGIGRFNLLQVVEYLEEMGINEDNVLVLDGRYAEFILYLDRPMDNGRKLVRRSSDGTLYYDISRKTYVQSTYFGYSELNEAVDANKKGIYVSSDKVILSENGQEEMKLSSRDFQLYDVHFRHINTINGFQIYSWDTS